MKEEWYPDFDDIMRLFVKLQLLHIDLKDANLMNEKAVRSILDKVKYGLPFRKTNFWEKTAILWHDISREHHFSNGNKRLGYFAMLTSLEMNGYSLKNLEEEMTIKFCVEIVEGKLNIKEISLWLRKNSKKI